MKRLFVSLGLIAALLFAAIVSGNERREFNQTIENMGLKISPSTLAYSADVEQGKQLASTRCIACHGATMLKLMPSYPMLEGQKAAYLFKQLVAFKHGERSNPIMQGQAAMLSEQQMKDVALYYSQQPTLTLR
ncbi:c-type cytochrome [Shewanella algidipiscicola]|uniref:Cytochrome c domain-containing protein n=1 Tax=Shewanella algidipiscicola TaxID=614070 RepID=A0ABQ4P9Q1_9GAMM|nr:cytochrome c [Shewanella algidipiscicola]GIU44254.1 hypothetical protein TUM4630_09500 [Shewanella algidipiscicola]